MIESDDTPHFVQSFIYIQELTASTASYESTSNPELVLRRGLIEEAVELAAESGESIRDSSKLAGELGDILWYVSEIARFRDVNPLNKDQASLDDYQQNPDPITPIYDKEMQQIKIEENPRAILAIASLRLVDTMNPKRDSFWRGLDGRVDLETALKDVLSVASYIANANNFSLNKSVIGTIEKLSGREREPAVVEELGKQALLTTGRDRLAMIDPLVKQFLD